MSNRPTETEGQSLRIERTIAAPVAMVWSMWTDAEHFKQWYGPGGAQIPVAELDLVVGGSRRVCMSMHTPDGAMTMWFGGEFLEITAPTRLRYTERLTNEQGNTLDPTAMGMPADHPTTTEVIVELTEAGGSTELVLTHLGVPADSGGAAGWAMALDALATYAAG